VTAAAAAAFRDDDGDGADCTLNSAHLFFRQDGGESYFGLGGRTSPPDLCRLRVQSF